VAIGGSQQLDLASGAAKTWRLNLNVEQPPTCRAQPL
jgi:hypothetical protein